MSVLKSKSSILFAKNIFTETCKTGEQLVLERGCSVYTTARSVYHNRIFQFSQQIDRLYSSLSGLFPEEQKKFGITREQIRDSVISNVEKARNYLCELDPSVNSEKLDVKFSIIIEKPSEENPLPMSVLISRMTQCRQPPIICDVYNVMRSNASIKHSSWVSQRAEYYEQSGKSVEEILLCSNDDFYEGGQSNFFAIKNGVVFTRGEDVLSGTMRTMVINICKKLNIPLSLTSPKFSEIAEWDACFITSTSRILMNINTIRKDGKVIKDFDGNNKVMQQIQDAIAEELVVESEPLF